MDELPETVEIMRDHAVRIMTLALMIRGGDIDFRGHDDDDCVSARELVAELAEECALHFGGMPAN